MIYFICIIFLLSQALTLAFIYATNQNTQKERQLLLDRIQATNLQEFKAYTEPEPETIKEEPKETIDYI